MKVKKQKKMKDILKSTFALNIFQDLLNRLLKPLHKCSTNLKNERMMDYDI